MLVSILVVTMCFKPEAILDQIVHTRTQSTLAKLESSKEFERGGRGDSQNRVRQRCSTWDCIVRLSPIEDQARLMTEIITPFSPWFLCDYFIGDEFQRTLGVPSQFQLDIQEALDCTHLPSMIVLFVQVNKFDSFASNCLDNLTSPIILITGQWHLPALKASKTKFLLTHPLIYHWFAQNPVHVHPKLTGLPYGIRHDNLQTLSRMISEVSPLKETTVLNLPMALTHPERAPFVVKNASKEGSKEELRVFYEKMRRSKYIISPMGDRPEAYRHWEAISFLTVPICNCPEELKQVFGTRMLFANQTAMLNWLNGTADLSHVEGSRKLNQDILTNGIWAKQIKQIQAEGRRKMVCRGLDCEIHVTP